MTRLRTFVSHNVEISAHRCTFRQAQDCRLRVGPGSHHPTNSQYTRRGVYDVALKRKEICFSDIPRRDPEHKFILALQGDPLGMVQACCGVTFFRRRNVFAQLLGGLHPCAACCEVGLRWLADVSCACVPLLVSCSGFGLPMHAQLLRLFVSHTLRNCLRDVLCSTDECTYQQQARGCKRCPCENRYHVAAGSRP